MNNNIYSFLLQAAPASGGGNGIGQIITNLTTGLSGQLTLGLSAAAALAIIGAAFYGIIMGSEGGAKAKGWILQIIIFYAIALSATQIITSIYQAVNGGGGFQ